MGFNIDGINRSSHFHYEKDTTEVYLLDEFQKAEKLGLTRIIIRKPQLMKYDHLIGQIFLYKSNGWKEEKNPMKYPWRLIEGKPHTVRKRRLGGEVEDEPGELIFERVDGEYLPKKDKFITQREVDIIIDKAGKGLWKVGRYLINESGYYGRIKSICVEDIKDNDLTNNSPKTNPHCDTIYMDAPAINIEFEDYIRANGLVFEKEKTYVFDFDLGEDEKPKGFKEFADKWVVIDDPDLANFEMKIGISMKSGNLDAFEEKLMLGTDQESRMRQDMGDDSTALMGMNSQSQLQVLHDNLYIKSNLSKSVQYSFKRGLTIKRQEMEAALRRETDKMELIKQRLEGEIVKFEKAMVKIQRIITTLEIYLGESESVVQIAEGKPADEGEPIALRQMMMYMDEEFGKTEDGGLDNRTLEEFDAWLVESGNFEKVIPDPKGVVVMRPRRNMKKYKEFGDDIWAAFARAHMYKLDSWFYILIRNGENLYKISTDKIDFGTRLFPLRAELQEMMDMISAGSIKMEESDSRESWQFRDGEEMVDKGNDKMFKYQRNFLLLQGIITRTNIFAPVPEDFNFMNVNTHKGFVNFIYDEENILADGKMRFKDYQRSINEQIKKGSRIIIAGHYDAQDYSDRLSGYVSDHAARMISGPDEGIYTVKSRMVPCPIYKSEYIPRSQWDELEKAHLLMKEKYKVIHKYDNSNGRGSSTSYNFPAGYYMKYEKGSSYREGENGEEEVSVYELDPSGDKILLSREKEELFVSYSYKHGFNNTILNRTFVIERTDDQIMNYDAIVLEDMDYYLTNRIDRPNYLSMMPVLRSLRKELIEERQHEDNFVIMTKSEILREYPLLSELDIESMVYDAIDWWKNKKATVWKRPISKNDSKAFEMVTQEVKRMCKKLGKNVKVGTDYREALLVWRSKVGTFYGYGLTKKDFSEQVKEMCSKRQIMRNIGVSKCVEEVRGIRVPREGHQTDMMNKAKEFSGTIQFTSH